MSDLTNRLRCAKFTVHETASGSVCAELDSPRVLIEAADEIDRLRVTNKMLMDDKAALQEEVKRLTKIIDDAWGEA
jgi:hypothetical protein